MASVSQILLKHSANRKRESFFKEYLNFEVLLAYFLLLISSLMVIFALQKIEYKNAAILNSLGQVLVLLMSWRLLGEILTRKKLIGITIIVIGVYVFFL